MSDTVSDAVGDARTRNPAAEDLAEDPAVAEQGVETLTTAPRETSYVTRYATTEGMGGAGVTLPRLGPLGWARWIWRQLTSMRVALILLFMLSLASIPGSLIPQRNEATNPAKVVDFLARHRTLGPIYDKLQLFEVYKSAWFSAIYLLLFISLIGCIIPRTWAHAKVLRKPPPPAPRNLSRMPVFENWRDETAHPDAVQARLDAAEKALRSKRFRVVRGEDAGGAGGWISGEKGYLREVGNLLFHVALIGILAGFAIKGFYGYQGKVLISEGETFTNAPLYYDDKDFGGGVDSTKLPPFQIKLEKFSAQYDALKTDSDFGAPRGFQADVSYSPAGSTSAKQQTISLNNPLSVDGVNVYLVSHGYAPVITVKDAHGTVVFHAAVKFIQLDPMFKSSGTVKILDGLKDSSGYVTQVGVQGLFLPTFDVTMRKGPQSLFPAADFPELILTAYSGDLGSTPSVYTMDTTKAKQLVLDPKNGRLAAGLQPGETVQLPNDQGSITFDSVVQYAQFDINHDPSKQLVFPSAIAIVLGLVLSLGIRRRRVFIRVRPGGGDDGTVAVEIAGLARAEDARLRDEVRGVATALRLKQKTAAVPKTAVKAVVKAAPKAVPAPKTAATPIAVPSTVPMPVPIPVPTAAPVKNAESAESGAGQ